MELQETPTPTPRKSALPYIIGVGVIALLAAAAFMAVRYFVQPKTLSGNGPGGNVISMQGPGGEAQTFALDIKPATELPATQPSEMGLFVERKDNSIFIGTGEVNVMVEANPGAGRTTDSPAGNGNGRSLAIKNTCCASGVPESATWFPAASRSRTRARRTNDQLFDRSWMTCRGNPASRSCEAIELISTARL